MLIETIRSRAAEGKTLSLGEYRSVAIPVFATLQSGVTSGTAQYRTPMNDFLVIRRILPHLAISAPSSESLVPAVAANAIAPNVTSFTGFDHIAAKAMNARLDFRVTDDDYTLFSGRNPSLISLFEGFGGGAIDYKDTPLRIRPGKTMQLRVSLNDASADAVGQPTEYGIVLVGALIRANSGKNESR